jgi:F0F1-type ATP synthase beta subunit
VFAGVGERTREGNDLYKEMIESVRRLRSLMRRLRQLWAMPVCAQARRVFREWTLAC